LADLPQERGRKVAAVYNMFPTMSVDKVQGPGGSRTRGKGPTAANPGELTKLAQRWFPGEPNPQKKSSPIAEES